jgi:AcrR family transcriptional regulator
VASTKERVLDAAIELLGAESLRALTHARVDECAGIPKGSTSNYFRTRAALLIGVADRILERELSAVRTALSPASPAELVDAFCDLFEFTVGVNRTLTTARLVLFIEASHNTALRDALTRGRAAMEATVIPALAQVGAHDPAAACAAIAACFDGLLLHNIARHDDADSRPTFDLVVRAAQA